MALKVGWTHPRLIVLEVAAVLMSCLAEELAAPKLHSPKAPSVPTMPALQPLPTLAVYNCLMGEASDWPEAQQTWCCKNQLIGCQTTTELKSTSTKQTSTTPKPKAESSVWTWGDDSEKKAAVKDDTQKAPVKDDKLKAPVKDDKQKAHLRRKKAATTTKLTTTAPLTTTHPVKTTTTNTCESSCVVNGVAATCRDQIQQASLADFLGNVDSCSLAQEVTAKQCPECAGCLPHQAGCGVLELDTTPAPTTTIPKGDPCKAVCTLGGQPATCTARIMWSKDHIFVDKPEPCKQAHAMVLEQCTVCNQCTLQTSTCGDQGQSAATEELFDCNSGAAVEWSDAKAVWCCEHHERGCDAVPQDKQVFFQKKVSDDAEAADAKQRLSQRGRAFAAGLIGLGTLGSVILLFARSSSTAARRSRRVRHNDRLVVAE